MSRSATRSRGRSRSRARNMGYPPEFFIEQFGRVPYTNRRYTNSTYAPLTIVGQELENRERKIRAYDASLRLFNNRRARLGYYNMVGATPATRSPRRSPDPGRSPSPKKSWCNFLGRCFTRKRRSK